jgi:hypothetical protein
MSVQFILTPQPITACAVDFLSTLYGFLTRSRHILSVDMERLSFDIDSPYINAPSWPWAVAGWTISAFHVLFFLAGWILRSA